MTLKPEPEFHCEVCGSELHDSIAHSTEEPYWIGKDTGAPAPAEDDISDLVSVGQNTLAEEPIENRLRRAWLNGFKEGVDRSAFAATEATGRWDY